MSATITALGCDTAAGKCASKTWRRGPDGKPQLVGFEAGWQFLCRVQPVTSIRDLAGFLCSLERETSVFTIRGVPVPGLDLSGPIVRRSRARSGEPATFQEAPGGLPWAMFDLDGLALPFDFDPQHPESAIRFAISCFPPCFQDVTCFWKLSSKAGMGSPRTLRAHLWFWFDRPVNNDAMSRWADTFGITIDTSLFRAVQPHFTAAPRFEDGIADPCPRRSGLLLGSREVVTVPDIPERPKRRNGASAGAGVAFAHYEQVMSKLGDGPGKRGFHNVIRDALYAYVMSGRTDFESIKADIRRRVEAAPKKEDRDPEYLEDITSDEELDRSIEGAQDERPRLAEVSRELLNKLAKHMKRSSSLRQQEQGIALEHVIEGTDPGPGMIDKLVHTLADPDLDAKSLAEHFAPSLQITPGAPSVEVLRQQIEQLQREAREQRIAAELAPFEENTDRIKQAFGGARDWPYTEPELEAIARDAGCTRAEFKHRWIIQHGKQFYLYITGHYLGPIVGEELITNASTFLAPAVTAGVELRTVDARGRLVPKTAGQLMADYGMPAREVIADMTAGWSRFDAATLTLIEAVCPLRPLSPQRDPDVEAWLRLLGGAKEPQLLDWIAVVSMLDKPAPALVLIGETGLGKSLLASGLARLFHEGEPTSLASIMGAFNSALLRCPLVFSDERLPTDWRGQPRTEEFRELIARPEHPLRRKYMSESSVRGSIRLILAANNHRLLATPGELTNADISAIAERLLYIVPDPAARAFLADKGGRDFTEKLVREDRIARHALWLRETRKVAGGGRWAVPGDCDELLREMRTGSGLRWPICHWIVSWLFDAQAHARRRLGGPTDAPAPIVVKDGKLYVHAESMRGGWSWYLPDERVPDLQRFRKSLEELCCPGDGARKSFGPRGARVWMRELELENLITWAEAQGERTREEILEALAVAEQARKGPALQPN